MRVKTEKLGTVPNFFLSPISFVAHKCKRRFIEPPSCIKLSFQASSEIYLDKRRVFSCLKEIVYKKEQIEFSFYF
jgi:hypothetical protein